MLKFCYKNDCTNSVSVACPCTNPKSYICQVHFDDHIRISPWMHNPENPSINLNPTQQNQLYQKRISMFQYLREVQETVLISSKMLVDSIQRETAKALENIKKLKKFLMSLQLNHPIAQENFDYLISLDFNSQIIFQQSENLNQSIENLFSFTLPIAEPWKECNEVIYSSNLEFGGLRSIDLSTFELSTLSFTPIIGPCCNACKIDKDRYFFHGGILENYRDKSEAYLINISTKSYEKLSDGPNKSRAGTAFMNRQIYLFGGYNDNMKLKTCEVFNLETNQWGRSPHLLPKVSEGITAAVLNGNIILSGFDLNCCYSYDNTAFTSILELPGEKYKVVAEGWIFVNSVLYENTEGNNYRWVKHRIDNSWDNCLLVYSVFKKGDYFYFIDHYNFLMRIDTKAKVLVRVR